MFRPSRRFFFAQMAFRFIILIQKSTTFDRAQQHQHLSGFDGERGCEAPQPDPRKQLAVILQRATTATYLCSGWRGVGCRVEFQPYLQTWISLVLHFIVFEVLKLHRDEMKFLEAL